MTGAVRVRPGAAVVSIAVAAAALAVALQHLVIADQAPAAQAPEGFDLVAAENGGRVEWATGQFWPAMYLLADTRHLGWMGRQNEIEEIVFSFFDHQSGLVERFLINPFVDANNDRPRDVEVWTSTANPTDGFTKVGAATLSNENRLQPVALEPVEAKFVKLRILSTYAPMPNAKPGGFAIAAKRVKIVEGQRAGYVSMLARNPALAALAKGVVAAPPPPAALPTTPAEGPGAS
jgi:hypothetical protein